MLITLRAYRVNDDTTAMVKSASFFITQGPKGVTQISSFVKCRGLLTLISVRLFTLERGNELCKVHPAGGGCTHCT